MLPIYRYIINYLRMWQSLHFTFDEHLNIYFYDDAFDFVKTRRTDIIVYNNRDFSENFKSLKLWRNRGENCQKETIFYFWTDTGLNLPLSIGTKNIYGVRCDRGFVNFVFYKYIQFGNRVHFTFIKYWTQSNLPFFTFQIVYLCITSLC